MIKIWVKNFEHSANWAFGKFFSDSLYQKLSPKATKVLCHKVTQGLLIFTCRTLRIFPLLKKLMIFMKSDQQITKFHLANEHRYTFMFRVSTVLGIIFHFWNMFCLKHLQFSLKSAFCSGTLVKWGKIVRNISYRVFRWSAIRVCPLLVVLGALTFLVLGLVNFCCKKSKVRNQCMDLPFIGAPRVEPGSSSGPFRPQRG